MAGLLNRIRRFTDDAGRPTTLGFHVIGDAHTTTNPILGRGCTLTALQAVMIADAYGEHPGRPLQRAMSYEAACRAEVEPWFENALQVEALERGLPSDGSPARFAAETIGALFASGQGDPLLGRALAQYVNLLRTPTQIATDPAIVEALTERTGAAASPSTGGEGPTREELLLHLDRSATTVAPPSPPPVTTRQVAVEGASLRVIASGPADGPAVVLVHGFPELARSWQHQVTALASAGYRVLAADQRGCGGSTGPAEIEGYDIHHLIGDLLGLLDAEELERAAFVGHDWGAMVVSTLALLHPDRVTGVVTLSVPLLARGPASPLQLLSAAAGEGFFYMSYFQEPGVADAELDRDPADTFLRMFADPTDPPSEEVAEGSGLLARLPRSDRPPAWLGQEGLAVYVEEYTRTGFTPALNLYRNLDRNWETTADLDGAQVTVPTAFITGSRDQVNLMLPAQVMDGHVTDHRFTAYVEGAGHWVQQERPDEVNGLLLRFLRSLGSNGNETGREDR